MLTAHALHRRALDEVNRGHHGRARELLSRAERRDPDPEVRARILLTRAYLESERGRVADGLALLDLVDTRVAPADVRARVSSQRGLLLMRAGDARAALDAFTASLDAVDDDPAGVALDALNRGDAYLLLRDLPAAAADFRRCSAIASAHGLDVRAAQAEHNLGYVELLAGDLPAALRRMESVRPVLAERSATFAAVCDTDRAQALLAAGLTTDADATLSSVAATYGRHRLRQSQAEVELLRARLALADRRPGDAIRTGHRAAARFRRRGSTSWALRADAVVLAGLVDCGRHAQALRSGPDLADALDRERLRDEARTVRLHLVTALLHTRALDQARRMAASLRTPITAPITSRLLDRAVRADLAAASRRRSVAAQHLRRGLAELFSWQSSFGSLDLQTGVAAHGRALAIRGLQTAVADGRPAVVFDWSERARAFASRVPPVRPPADREAALALEELRALRAAAAGSEAVGSDLRRMAELERQVRDHALYPPGPGLVTEPLGLDELQASLVPDAGTLVSHLVVDQHLHALVVTQHDAVVHRLGPYAEAAELMTRVAADLGVAATRLPPALRRAVGSSLQGACGELDKLLFGPLPRDEGPVLLVPSALLAATPWTLLPTLAGRPVAVARTATSWALTRRPGEVIDSVGLVAGPAVDRADEEVRRAARAWPAAAVVRGAEATAATVTALACRVDLLHVAAHGTHSADNPLFSGLELCDGPWFGHDIAAVDPVPGHVVLSACELGRATVRAGEETLGMTAAWQHAGARTVVASPARVNDDAACEVLAVHHRRLAAGDRPAVALAAATTDLPGDLAPAPLICFGAGW